METPFENRSARRRLSKRQKIWLSVLALLVFSGGGLAWYHELHNRHVQALRDETLRKEDEAIAAWTRRQIEESITPATMPQSEDEDALEWLPAPPPPSMERIKRYGCVADGLLNGYGDDTDEAVGLINRSQCYYLHRALETWLEAPDFEKARKIQAKITKPNTVYGMFIAEAIRTNTDDYYYSAEDRNFNFRDMCRPDSKNDWGEHSCKPSLEKEEYRKYVMYITETAMDMGIQSFMFGQVFYQDNPDPEKSRMPELIAHMREYAAFRGMKILIGAQTNDITDERYLRLFDYIEGGVGLSAEGTVEDNACFSRWWKKPGDWCWALLWHPTYKNRAQNVLVHLDWSGRIGDDMSTFTRMGPELRARTLERLHQYFDERNVGFLMPMMATLHADNAGCRGPDPNFYSASRRYSCADEEAINRALRSAH